MTVSLLFAQPKTRNEMAQWSFQHLVHHRDVINYIYRKFGVTLPEYQIDPVMDLPPETFEYNHQLMHNNQDSILNVSGFDLTSYNLFDPDQRDEWLYLNAQLHYVEATATGVF